MMPAPILREPADRHICHLALFTAAQLRRVDSIALADLGQILGDAADRRRVPRFTDNSQLVRIMQRLGWQKRGYAGEGASKSPLYVRVATANLQEAS